MADLTIKQGTDGAYLWPVQDLEGNPFDLTGYVVRAQIRSYDGTLLHSFSSDLDNVLVAGGFVTLLWTSPETTGWRWKNGKYDIEMVSPSNMVTQLDRGFVTLIPEVTR